MRNNISKIVTLLTTLLILSSNCNSEEKDKYYTITLENDIISGADGGYTNGLGFSWAKGPFNDFNGNIPSWMHSLTKDLTISTAANKKRAVSYFIAQGMQTANDITISSLVEEDAPYVGLLLWKASLYSFDEEVGDRLSLTLGIVGPASLAEKIQKGVHSLTGSDEPLGWDNQIENEVVFRLSMLRSRQIYQSEVNNGRSFDLVTNLAAGLGTIKSDMGGGLILRYGQGLSRSFQTASHLPGRDINPLAGGTANSWNVYLSLTGSYVLNSIATDGNTFRDSHSVELRHEQSLINFGASFSIGDWAYVISVARGSELYETQQGKTKFGSMSATYNFK